MQSVLRTDGPPKHVHLPGRLRVYVRLGLSHCYVLLLVALPLYIPEVMHRYEYRSRILICV
jgi:hypothetical protein